MKIKGLIAAVATPMYENGEVNYQAIDTYAEFLIARGVDGAFVNGTTGEGILMDSDERKKVAERWMKYADRLNILVHVGSTSYKMAADLAAHAEKIGAKAISAMGPCFLQPRNVEELVEFNRLVAEGAPNTPFYYYNIPVTSGVKVGMREFLALAAERIPTFNGIKYTSYDSWEELDCIRFDGGRFDILHGHDEAFLTGLLLGATGGIGTTYNVTSRIYRKIIEAFDAGDVKKAADLQYEANKVVKICCDAYNSVVGIKAMLEILGVPAGSCRLPQPRFPKENYALMEKAMREFDWLF